MFIHLSKQIEWMRWEQKFCSVSDLITTKADKCLSFEPSPLSCDTFPIWNILQKEIEALLPSRVSNYDLYASIKHNKNREWKITKTFNACFDFHNQNCYSSNFAIISPVTKVEKQGERLKSPLKKQTWLKTFLLLHFACSFHPLCPSLFVDFLKYLPSYCWCLLPCLGFVLTIERQNIFWLSLTSVPNF